MKSLDFKCPACGWETNLIGERHECSPSLSDEIERPREWTEYCAENEEFWLMQDSSGQVRVMYDPPPEFMQIPTIHVVRKSSLDTLAAEVSRLKARETDAHNAFTAVSEENDTFQAKLTAANSLIERLCLALEKGIDSHAALKAAKAWKSSTK